MKRLPLRLPLAAVATAVLLAAALGSASAAADTEPALEPADAFPAAVPEALRAALTQPGHRVTLDGKVLAELWLRQTALPTGGINEGALSVEFGALPPSTFIGVIHFPEAWIDYRETEVPAGAYTLRYWVQPADGDHMGVSQYRDFLMLCPAAEDTDPGAEYEQDPLMELSKKASGKTHPAVIALFPVAEAPASGAALVRNDLDQLTLAVTAGDSTFGFVLEGHGDLP